MDSFTKYNFRSKVSIEIAPWLKISNNTSYKKDSYPFPGPGAINNLFDAISKHALASIVPIIGWYIYGECNSYYRRISPC